MMSCLGNHSISDVNLFKGGLEWTKSHSTPLPLYMVNASRVH